MPKCKPIPTEAHGVKIIADLGFCYLTPQAKTKKRVITVECIDCEQPRNIAASTLLHSGLGQRCPKCSNRGSNNGAYKHGGTNTRVFNIWRMMIARCENEKDANYHKYGGRGISVCVEWQDFKAFEHWIDGRLNKANSSVDRLEVDGNYEPDNVMIIPLNLQAFTRRNSYGIKVAIAMAMDIKERGKLLPKYYKLTYGITLEQAKRFLIMDKQHKELQGLHNG